MCLLGGRLSEMLHVLGMAMEDDAPKTAAEVPPPGWVGRMMFRPVLAVYARKDHGAEKGSASSVSWPRRRESWRCPAASGSLATPAWRRWS